MGEAVLALGLDFLRQYFREEAPLDAFCFTRFGKPFFGEAELDATDASLESVDVPILNLFLTNWFLPETTSWLLLEGFDVEGSPFEDDPLLAFWAWKT